MPSHAIYSRVLNVEPFDQAGTPLDRMTIEVWIDDISGCRAIKTQVTFLIAAGDTGATIQSNFAAAVQAKATALGYSVAVGATIMPQFVKV